MAVNRPVGQVLKFKGHEEDTREKPTTKIYSRAAGTEFQVDNAEEAMVRISTQLNHEGRKQQIKEN